MAWMLNIVVFSVFVASCAHRDSRAIAPAPGVVAADRAEARGLAKKVPAAVPKVAESDLNDAETDMANLPAVLNKNVDWWLEYFQGRGRDTMRRHLARSSRYLPKMKEILRKEGLPEDLVYIALIESGFNPKAHSSASAVGYWQFIRGTAKRYGLKQNYYVDDRRDYIASTVAASQYLKALYNLFGSWYLAMASYNVGENRIKNLVMRHYTRDFWQLARDKRLPRETENYVPKFLAARLIAKHPEKYGFDDVAYEAPLDFKEVTVKKGVQLKTFAKHAGVSYEEIRGLNPSYLRGVIPDQKGGTVIRVPSQLEDAKVLAALDKSVSTEKMRLAATKSYRIRRGDTLSHIAQRYGTSIRALRNANGFTRRTTLYPGRRIVIPTRGGVARAVATTTSRSGETKYKVRRGDNLYDIARKFGTSVSVLKKRNRLGRRSIIRPGKLLVIPTQGGGGSSRYHTVRSGDTLIAIANKYKLKMSKLMRLNKLGRSQTLSIGKRLLVRP